MIEATSMSIPVTLLCIQFLSGSKIPLPNLQVYWINFSTAVTDIDGYIIQAGDGINPGSYSIAVDERFINIKIAPGMNKFTINVKADAYLTDMALVVQDSETKKPIIGMQLRVSCGGRAVRTLKTEEDPNGGTPPCVRIGVQYQQPTCDLCNRYC